jgi:hypothetical protein
MAFLYLNPFYPRKPNLFELEKWLHLLFVPEHLVLVNWKAWLQLVFVPEHHVLGSLESMAPSSVCPRTSCFGFTGKHGSIFCLSQNILFWVHWKA